MLRPLLLALTLLAVSAPARAQTQVTLADLTPETFVTRLPGPDGGDRLVYYWRPASAPEGPLPVLYMADGLNGLLVAASELRDDIEAGRARPFMIVAIQASANNRTNEYALGRRGNAAWERHFAWFTDTVMPWAEANAGASAERSQRGVGGFSNGADFALAAADHRPDLFALVLAHSPVNRLRPGFHAGEDTRWVITAGRSEGAGSVAALNGEVRQRIGAHPLRQCIGPWGHNEEAWRDLSPGAIAWLFELGDVEALQTETERAHCQTRS